MVVYCCGSGCFGCVCVLLELVPEGGSPLRKRLHWMQMHLDPSSPDAVWSLPWRCNNLLFLGLQKATLGIFRGRCGALVFVRVLSGFCPVPGVIRWWFTVAEALLWMRLRAVGACSPFFFPHCGSGYIGCRCIWTHLLQMQSGRCLGGVIIFFF